MSSEVLQNCVFTFIRLKDTSYRVRQALFQTKEVSCVKSMYLYFLKEICVIMEKILQLSLVFLRIISKLVLDDVTCLNKRLIHNSYAPLSCHSFKGVGNNFTQWFNKKNFKTTTQIVIRLWYDAVSHKKWTCKLAWDVLCVARICSSGFQCRRLKCVSQG